MALITTDKRRVGHFNWVFTALVFLLIAFGLTNLFSTLNLWGGEDNLRLFWSQLIWVFAGLCFMFFLAFFDYRLLDKLALPTYIITTLLLIAVLLFGKEVAGHRSWLSLFGFAVQPSEFAKIALILLLSRYFGRRPRPEGVALVRMWRPLLYAMIPAALVAMQGDFGSSIFFVLIFGTYAWFGRLRGRGITILVVVAILGALILYLFGMSDYQKSRLATFVDPSSDLGGSGYHLMQSRIAVGSGGLLGKGYMKGSTNKLRYLPSMHTDFVFPVLAEEWGFAGCGVVLLTYFLLLAAGIEVAKKARDRLGLFLAIGIVAFIFWHIVINLGGVLGLMPLTGVTLPFMSYGGSSSITILGTMGILLSISMRRFLF